MRNPSSTIALGLAMALACALGPQPAHSAPGDPVPGEVQIELRSQISTTRGEVRLGEVSIIRTRDYTSIERLVGLTLGPAPREGTQAVVRREAIARWIRSQLGITRDQMAWSGSEQVVVRASQAPAVTDRPTPSIAHTPLVTRGDWIVLQLKSGAVELERRVEVMQDGALGQVIKVRGENGAASVDGRVIAAGRVEALR